MAESLLPSLAHDSSLCSPSCSFAPPPSPSARKTSAAPPLALSFSASSASHRSGHCPFFGTDAFRGSIRSGERPSAQIHLQARSATVSDDGVKWWEKDEGAHLMDVHSAQELTDAVNAAEGKLVIVEFFASWCGSCRALYPKLCKLALEHQDIVFLKINFDENKPLCKSLNIKVLPYFHFYRGAAGQVDSFSCSITKLQRLKDAIAKHNGGGDVFDNGGALTDSSNTVTGIADEQRAAAGLTS